MKNRADKTDPPRPGALLALPDGRVAVGLGPFQAAKAPLPGKPAFFAPDFFLRLEAPWKHPAEFHLLTPEKAAHFLPPPPEEKPSWKAPDPAPFFEAFRELQEEIRSGRLAKAVPVVFEEAPLPPGRARRLPGLALRAFQAPPPSRAYAFWEEESGLAGATPETLFRIEADGTARTMALAGTRPLEQAGELLEDPKERKEHQLVADFLEEALAPLGKVRRGPTRVARLARLAHLETPFTLEPARSLSFQELVEALHPTPALGGFPREAAREWLARRDDGVGRGRFGAPFGLRLPGGEAFCVVAIRCVQWEKGILRLGSGCGVVDGSVPEREWEELAQKREAVKWMLGL